MEEKEVIVMDHPLIQHKISMLREKGRGTMSFVSWWRRSPR